jgi:hypothetical protein
MTNPDTLRLADRRSGLHFFPGRIRRLREAAWPWTLVAVALLAALAAMAR